MRPHLRSLSRASWLLSLGGLRKVGILKESERHSNNKLGDTAGSASTDFLMPKSS